MLLYIVPVIFSGSSMLAYTKSGRVMLDTVETISASVK